MAEMRDISGDPSGKGAQALRDDPLDERLPERAESEAAPFEKSSARGDWGGRIIGMLVFLLGIGLLIVVFQQANALFSRSPDAALGLKFTGNPKTDPTLAQVATRFGYLLLQTGYLVIMSVAGAVVAQKGINLYFSAWRGASGRQR
ncbi:MAG: hypothetical protein RMJ43_08360 [Chloroherpetonaceae bacterium]|nr:hypothetical protein [Chthonomonadaceae bacterium]MDW8207834.1 hypothetical protein [Chloroherpetonaceae bacterium]